MPNVQTQAGFTLLEMLVVMAVLGIILSLGVSSYLSTRNPPREAARTVHAALFTLRSQAMSNTQARRLVLVNEQELVLQSALRCSETDQSRWTRIGTIPIERGNRPLTLITNNPTPADPTVPSGTLLVVCYTPRGLASRAGFLGITDGRRTHEVEVALGGGLRTNVR